MSLEDLRGKIAILSPEQAALAAEAVPDLADRIYTLPEIDPGTVYLVDLDALAEGFDFRWGFVVE